MQSSIPFFPEQASTVASRVDNLYFFLIAVSGFFAVLVTVLVILFAIKYRRRHIDEIGEPRHRSTPSPGMMKLMVASQAVSPSTLATPRPRPRGVSRARPLRGGPILAHCSVTRQSRCGPIAPSSLLALDQNRLRHNASKSPGQSLDH